MIELPEVILKALDERNGQPLQVVDPRTKVVYVVIPAQAIEAIQNSPDEDPLEGIDVGRLIAEVMREDDENDPTLESYQEYKRPS